MKIKFLAAVVLSSILTACGVSTTPQRPSGASDFKPTLLGAITLVVDSQAKTSTLTLEPRSNRATNFPDETKLKFVSSSFSTLDATTGSNRFLNALFTVENNDSIPLNNLTLIAYNRLKPG